MIPIGINKNIRFTAIFKRTINRNTQPALYFIVASGTKSVKINENSKHPSRHISLKD
jgi:hypothetical protein